MSGEVSRKRDSRIYLLASVLGLCAGVIDVRFGDLLLTAVFVMASTMTLGALRPKKPWRWILLIGALVPFVQILAYLVLTEKPTPAEIDESFLGFLTGSAGAYAGAFGRMAVDQLFPPNAGNQTKVASGSKL
jgi:hypothetical protein